MWKPRVFEQFHAVRCEDWFNVRAGQLVGYMRQPSVGGWRYLQTGTSFDHSLGCGGGGIAVASNTPGGADAVIMVGAREA
jgi:hypothetical protein